MKYAICKLKRLTREYFRVADYVIKIAYGFAEIANAIGGRRPWGGEEWPYNNNDKTRRATGSLQTCC